MKTLMIDVVDRCYKFLSELFLTGKHDDLINMLKERDLLAMWHDSGARSKTSFQMDEEGDRARGRQSENTANLSRGRYNGIELKV